MTHKTKTEPVDALDKLELKVSLLKRMMEAHALALTLGLTVDITVNEVGPVISIYSLEHDPDFFEYAIDSESEEWQLENVERKLQYRKEERMKKEARRTLAQSVVAAMTQEQRDALKENIQFLR